MTEQQRYEIVDRFPGFELRRFAPHLVAEVEVDGSFTDAGNSAFGVLVAFISGRNTSRAKVAMTAPVVQESAGTQIAMTAPVIQAPRGDSGRYRVGFVMPSEFSLATLPEPTDPRISIRQVPSQLAAARGFTGRWTERRYREQLAALGSAVVAAGLAIAGEPRFARFDPPWTPPFRRRNEVVVPVAAGGGAAPSSS